MGAKKVEENLRPKTGRKNVESKDESGTDDNAQKAKYIQEDPSYETELGKRYSTYEWREICQASEEVEDQEIDGSIM